MLSINPEVVKEINDTYFKTGVKSDHLVKSAFSSYHYYDSYAEMVASVYVSIIKNHPFNDANKRTATVALLYEIGKEPTSDEALFNLALETASKNADVNRTAVEIQKIFGI